MRASDAEVEAWRRAVVEAQRRRDGELLGSPPAKSAAGSRDFNPDEPRIPHGAGGGRWTSGLKTALEMIGHASDAQTPMTSDQVKAEFQKVVDGRYGGFRARVDHVEMEPGSVTVFGSVLDENRNRAGIWKRTISEDVDGALFAEHDILDLNPSAQGHGFATAFNQDLERWYRQSGVQRIELQAARETGGYAWASAGYDFRLGAVPAQIVDRLRQYASDPAVADVLSRIHRREHVSAHEISQLGRPDGAGYNDTWIGKTVMLGTNWWGVMFL